MTEYPKLKVYDVSEEKKKPIQKIDWLAEGLLRFGHHRPSLISGKPETGKSTVTRQSVVAASKGTEWLGRKFQKVESLYITTEDAVADVTATLTQMGYSPESGDAKIHVIDGNDILHWKQFREALDAYPGVRYVVLETFSSLFKVKQINDNSEVQAAFESFNKAMSLDFLRRVPFLILHQLNKKEAAECGDSLQGATALRANTDSKLYTKKEKDAPDARRIMRADVRAPKIFGGRSISETICDFREDTLTVTLGNTVEAEIKAGDGLTHKRIRNDIKTYLKAHPDAPIAETWLPVIEGHTTTKLKVYKRLCNEGLISRRVAKGNKPGPGNPWLHKWDSAVETLRGQLGELPIAA